MSDHRLTGSIDPTLSGSATDVELLADVPEGVIEVIGAETARHIEQSVADVSRLSTLRELPNPFTERISRPNEIDLSGVKPEIAAEIQTMYQKRQKPSARLRKMSTSEFKGVLSVLKTEENALAKNGRAANEAIHKLSRDDVARLLEMAEDIEVPVDIEEFEAARGRLETIAATMPTDESVRMLKVLWEISGAKTSTHHNQVMRAAGSKPSQRPVLGAFKALRAGEKKMIDFTAGSLNKVNELLDILKRMGSEAHAALTSVTSLEETKRAADLMDAIRSAKTGLTEQADGLGRPELEALAEAESYLIERARFGEAALLGVDAKPAESPEAQRELQQIKTPFIARRLEELRQAAAAGLSRRLTEANDILLGGRRLKPNKRLRQPDRLADQLDKLLNGEGQNHRPEKGIIIAILSGRFDDFVETLALTQSEETLPELETLKAGRGKLIEELSNVPLPEHMEELEVILVYYEEKLMRLLGRDNLALLQKTVDDFYGRRPAGQPAQEATPDEPALGAEEVLARFKRNELIGILDWTVLPIEHGEEALEEAARDIVEQARQRAEKGAKVEIDLNRLNILKKLREQWGKDRCEYFRGTLRNKGSDIGSDRPDEYIVLVMKELDEHGNTVLEHAVAESPIARINALYITRGDTAAGSWREIFALPKPEARELGARKLLHSKGDGRPMVDLLAERVQILLTCNPEDFSRIRFDGAGFYISKLGRLAATSTS